jgi:hypothetical protein
LILLSAAEVIKSSSNDFDSVNSEVLGLLNLVEGVYTLTSEIKLRKVLGVSVRDSPLVVLRLPCGLLGFTILFFSRRLFLFFLFTFFWLLLLNNWRRLRELFINNLVFANELFLNRELE